MKRSTLTTVPIEDEFGAALRSELLSWKGVRARPMMGCMAFYRGKHMIGCYVNRDLSRKKPWWMNRANEPTLAWVRLRESDAIRALKRSGVRACRTGAKNWIEIPLQSGEMIKKAISWFGVAYDHPPPQSRKTQSSK